MLSRFSHVATPWTVALQAPLSMRFSKQEYKSGLPCPSPKDLPNPGIKPASLISQALAGRFFATSLTWEIQCVYVYVYIYTYTYTYTYVHTFFFSDSFSF